MAVLINRDPLIQQLIKAFNIPKTCTAFTIRCALDEIVTIKCEFHADANEEGITDIIEYRLEEIKDRANE